MTGTKKKCHDNEPLRHYFPMQSEWMERGGGGNEPVAAHGRPVLKEKVRLLDVSGQGAYRRRKGERRFLRQIVAHHGKQSSFIGGSE